MIESLCHRCLEALPASASACARCGTPRPPRPRRPVVSPGLRAAAPRAAAVTMGALLVAALTTGGLLLARALGNGAPAPEAAGRLPVTSSTADGIQVLDAAAALRLPGGADCVVEDHFVPAAQCLRWAVQAPPDRPFALIVADERLVVAAAGAELVALDARDGAVRWRWRPPSASDLAAAPSQLALADGKVIALFHGAPGTVALDASSGTLAWTAAETARPAWMAVAGAHEAGPPVVVVRHPDQAVVLALDTGAASEPVPLQPGGFEPAIAGGNAVMADGDRLVAVDLVQGTRRWTADVDVSAVSISPIHVHPVVVAVSRAGELVAVDSATGVIRWRERVPGLIELVDLRDGRVAAVTGTGLRTFDAASGEPGPALTSPGAIHAAFPAGPGELLAGIGHSLQRLDADLGGETWTLRATRPRRDDNAALVHTGSNRFAVAALSSGEILASFDVPPAARSDDPACGSVRPSEAMGGLDAWRGDRVHVAPQPGPGRTGQLFVGAPAGNVAVPFTVSATRRDHPGVTAQFSDGGGAWTAELTVRSGGRTSTGWPPHWAVLVRFPEPGCWEVRVGDAGGTDTVVVLVAAG